MVKRYSIDFITVVSPALPVIFESFKAVKKHTNARIGVPGDPGVTHALSQGLKNAVSKAE